MHRSLKSLIKLTRNGIVRSVGPILRSYGFEQVLTLPVVYTDQHGLHYVLYPGQNAEIYFQNQGNYEVAETRFCTNFVRPGMLILDVGANIGLYTLLFAKLTGQTGFVHAFEPELKNYRRLCANIYLNGFEETVKVNRSAVFSKSQIVSLNTFPDAVNAWHTLGELELPDPWNSGQTIKPASVQKVPAFSLDDYCTQNDIQYIDFLKIDVEGAELDVLQGASDLFRAGKINCVMFEVSLPQIQGMGHNPEEIYRFFQERDYEIYQIVKDGDLTRHLEAKVDLYQNFVAMKNPQKQSDL